MKEKEMNIPKPVPQDCVRWSLTIFVGILSIFAASPCFATGGEIGKDGNAVESTSATRLSAEPLAIYIFERPGCDHCENFERIFVQLPAWMMERVQVHRYNIDEGNNRILLGAYLNMIEATNRGATTSSPYVFFSNRNLDGESAATNIKAELETVLAEPDAPPTPVPNEDDLISAERTVVDRFSSTPLIAIMIAGLVDGVNPCIFTAIIFFVSLLSVAKLHRGKLLAVGLTYCAASYMTYFLMGAGLLGALSVVSGAKTVATILYWGMGAVLIVLSVLSFRDALRYRLKKDESAITLQLPSRLKERVQNVMRYGLKARYLLPGIFGVGVAVTLLESACTAQLYLPTMAVLLRHGGLTPYTFALLALYNLMCIIPLLIVFGCVFHGANMFSLLKMGKNQIFWSKVGLGFLFLALSVILLLSK